MRVLAARVPKLEIFTQGLVVREGSHWGLTEAGRRVLSEMEYRHPQPSSVDYKVTGASPAIEEKED